MGEMVNTLRPGAGQAGAVSKPKMQGPRESRGRRYKREFVELVQGRALNNLGQGPNANTVPVGAHGVDPATEAIAGALVKMGMDPKRVERALADAAHEGELENARYNVERRRLGRAEKVRRQRQ